ncbi:MAG: uroporphyrinogen-III C-methyltransferase [Gammaproteobacteria bacterium]|nr:uroporphyrinogen-III C-methyltransferase [Gammaproteobacteria bacterium]
MISAKVFLVGAGPGDPDLLTVKALRLIQEAEVIVYDRLISPGVLALIPAGTKRIYAGKAPGAHHLDQDSINSLLVNLARKGHSVVRLKGGDPFVFGRGSEEAVYLSRHNIDFEVVPGITAATACLTYAGIPLTHRGMANSAHLIAGHCSADDPLNLDWKRLANDSTTLVFYMALSNLEQVSSGLVGAGLPGDTPAAIIEKGTTPQQRCLITRVDELTACASTNIVESPALIVIGQVVHLERELSWFGVCNGGIQYEDGQKACKA